MLPTARTIRELPVGIETPSGTRSRFRLRAKKIFLTYSQVLKNGEFESLDDDGVLAQFHTKLLSFKPDILITAIEKHKDGGLHIHVYICNMSGFVINDVKYFDFQNIHPNIRSVRSMKKCIRYVSKDGKYLLYGISEAELDAYRQVQSSVLVESAKAIAFDPALYDSIISENPELMVKYGSGLHRLYNWACRNKVRLSRTPKPFDSVSLTNAQSDINAINTWLSSNLCRVRKRKQLQLYLYSADPNVGKTYLVDVLYKYYRLHYPPVDCCFDDLYQDGVYDLIIFDDYNHAYKKVSWLNKYLEGQRMFVDQKGSGLLKNHVLPIIMLSNTSIDDLYCRVSANILRTLKARLQIVCLDNIPNAALFKYSDLLDKHLRDLQESSN